MQLAVDLVDARSRTQSRKSVATWSLRERAVCSRPAASPISSASRASTFMWMSSSARENVKLPCAISDRDRVQARDDLLRILGRNDALIGEHLRMRVASRRCPAA